MRGQQEFTGLHKVRPLFLGELHWYDAIFASLSESAQSSWLLFVYGELG